MAEFWEDKFSSDGAMWQFEPSDSALLAATFFSEQKAKNVLIPGFGYGRNANPFLDNGINLTGIEISKSAINIAKENGVNCAIHHGSVTEMPFDNKIYDGIFCYALIHLLNKYERKRFLQDCFAQLKPGGHMIFNVVSSEASMFETGRNLSKNRFKIANGVNVFFYQAESIEKEFSSFGLLNFRKIEEPIKFMKDAEPLKCYYITCRKGDF